MQGTTTPVLQSLKSSPVRKIQKKKPKDYSTYLLYNTAEATNKLKDLKIATCNPSNEERQRVRSTDITEEQKEFRVQQRDDYTSISDKMSCNYCSVVFDTRTEQKQHFQSDWHRYNLKQRLKGDNCVTMEEFESQSACVSSISGSESETTELDDIMSEKPRTKPTNLPSRRLQQELDGESSNESESDVGSVKDEVARKYPKVYFQNTDGELISLYRCVIYHKKNQPSSHSELVSWTQGITDHMNWAVLMASGGHFAGVIFNKNEIVVHKTFHRYVVRAKRGSAQSSRDSQGNAPKSAGASLRRYNEAALKEDIIELLASWDSHLSKCDLIFLRAPGFNKKIFFSGKTPPLKKDDERIRMIPFPTRRPTHNEVRRVHEMLASVECYGDEADIQDHIPISPTLTFSAETGHLEIVTDETQTSPQHRKNKDRTKRGTSPLAYTDDVTEDTEYTSKGQLDQVKQKVVAKGQQINLIDSLIQNESLTNSSATSTASESELAMEMETLSTLDLKEFGGTKKPKRKKKQNRKRRSSLRHQTAPEADALAEERYHLKNSLYTACKVGDLDSLKNLLAVFTANNSADTPVPSMDQSASSFDPYTDQSDATPVPADESVITPVPFVDQSYAPVFTLNQSKYLSSNIEKENSELDENHVNSSPSIDMNMNVSSEPQHSDRFEICETKNSHIEDSGIQKDDSCFSVTKSDVENSIRNIETDEGKIPSEHSKIHVERSGLKLKINSESDQFPRKPMSEPQNLLSPFVTIDILNEPIGDSEITLLHVAAKSGHKIIVRKLLENGADPAIKDKFGKPPYCAATEKETRNEFRRFMGRYPDKYDYITAQVPSPLTAEMESEKKKKESERKKIQKKAKQDKMKEQRAEEEKQRAEEGEKKRFLSLSDREKRALAAERRLVQQKVEKGEDKPMLSRCFQCGSDMTGKTPFEYFDYKFCSSKCLQQHRKTTSNR